MSRTSHARGSVRVSQRQQAIDRRGRDREKRPSLLARGKDVDGGRLKGGFRACRRAKASTTGGGGGQAVAPGQPEPGARKSIAGQRLQSDADIPGLSPSGPSHGGQGGAGNGDESTRVSEVRPPSQAARRSRPSAREAEGRPVPSPGYRVPTGRECSLVVVEQAEVGQTYRASSLPRRSRVARKGDPRPPVSDGASHGALRSSC